MWVDNGPLDYIQHIFSLWFPAVTIFQGWLKVQTEGFAASAVTAGSLNWKENVALRSDIYAPNKEKE